MQVLKERGKGGGDQKMHIKNRIGGCYWVKLYWEDFGERGLSQG
jgi:hypothetical protein